MDSLYNSFHMNKFVPSLSEIAREAYANAKLASDETREKSTHFYNEKRAGGLVSALGRIRKYTRTKNNNSAFGALFSGTSGLALIVANQIQTASVATIQLLKSAATNIQASFVATQPDGLSSLSNRFHVETQFVNEQVAEAIKIHKIVALRDAHDMATGDFIGPMRAETQELVRAVQRGGTSFNDFQSQLFERRGLIELPSHDFGVAVSADRLNTIRSAFGNSNGATSVYVYRPMQKIASPAPTIEPASLTPAFSN